MLRPMSFVRVALAVCLCAGGAAARPPAVEILAPDGYAPSIPLVEVRFAFDEGGLLHESVEVEVDGVAVQFDPEYDGKDNDGDGLVDEPGETMWSELGSASALMRAWMPYSLRSDDPATPENEGEHTIRVGAYNTQREWGETERSFLVTTSLSSLQAHCYPNPFIPEEGSAQVTFTLTSSAEVTIEVFDFAGKKLATLCKDRWRDAGVQRSPCDRWWGKDHGTDRRVPAGVYFVRVKAERDGQEETAVIKVGVLPKP